MKSSQDLLEIGWQHSKEKSDLVMKSVALLRRDIPRADRKKPGYDLHCFSVSYRILSAQLGATISSDGVAYETMIIFDILLHSVVVVLVVSPSEDKLPPTLGYVNRWEREESGDKNNNTWIRTVVSRTFKRTTFISWETSRIHTSDIPDSTWVAMILMEIQPVVIPAIPTIHWIVAFQPLHRFLSTETMNHVHPSMELRPLQWPITATTRLDPTVEIKCQRIPTIMEARAVTP